MRPQLLLSAILAARQATAAHSGFGGFDGFHDGVQRPLTAAGPDREGLVAGIRLDAQSPASCAACEVILLQLKIAAARGDDFFVRVTTEICKRLALQDDDVCEGSIALEGPIVAHGLRGIAVGSKTSWLACVAFMGLCSYPKVEQRNVSFPSPKPSSAPAAGIRGRRKPLRFVHYSDIHVDPFYVEGAEANCSKPICCRNYSDLDGLDGNTYPAGPNGEHTCDAPISLEESMYAAIQDIVPGAAFSIFTGDIVDHAVWNTSKAQNTLDITGSYGRMDKAVMLVYGTAGNHEASPSNSYPPTAVNHDAQWLYDVLSSTWSRWIGPKAADTTKEFGGYSVKHPDSRLRVISLSTNMYYTHNYWLYEEPMEEDPSGQFAWLISELDAAEKAAERVYIIGHMPMGGGDSFHDASNYFDQIVNRYSSTIASLFFGHTHLDEFEVSYSDYGNRNFSNAVAMSYIAPSMTPTSGHPTFRVYTVDPDTFGVLDATTYIANMSNPAFQTTGPVWTKYYSAREAYGPLVTPPLAEEEDEELTPAFWHNVTEALEQDPTAFEAYWARKRRGWEVDDCDEQCAEHEICKLRAGRAQDNCVVPGIKKDLVRRPPKPHGLADECTGSVTADVLGAMARDGDALGLFGRIVAESDGVGDLR
ncbi:Uu.00g093530.m01.CDS01 [Anthostomella pinea]|uniref:Sphingomyelin phosphodiesterase n=1 Tax=Anthostomella pinea TaxID=933095 RepID=A0AAI8VP55_9PEZI|nr:Uu.00g093530.m01.CDS01 [Anthostomella pinea]